VAANALIQTRIDLDVKQRASAVLEAVGLTVSDAVRILLTKTANEGALPFSVSTDAVEYDVWFRQSVQEAIDSTEPTLSSEEVETYFAKRRADALRKADELGE
jgi:DNA-damage-inducible protein J